MKKFKKEFLQEVLQFNEDEIKLTMEAQKKFPSILTNDGQGCCVNARTIYKELEVGKDFSNWIKNNLEIVDAMENSDYIVNWINDKGVIFEGDLDNTRVTDLTGMGYKKEYFITVDIAKEIAMISGTKGGRTNDKLKANSKLARKYFILIEKAIKGLSEHTNVREPEKENYNKMVEELIKNYANKHSNVTGFDKKYLRIRESNMINKELIGYTASEIKSKLGYLDEQTREHLIIEQNKAIDYLQSMITGLIIAGVDFEERSKIVENICNNKYSELRMDKEEIIKVS
jgi:phage anti-repressor protein